jgi:hypothetical protein
MENPDFVMGKKVTRKTYVMIPLLLSQQERLLKNLEEDLFNWSRKGNEFKQIPMTRISHFRKGFVNTRELLPKLWPVKSGREVSSHQNKHNVREPRNRES